MGIAADAFGRNLQFLLANIWNFLYNTTIYIRRTTETRKLAYYGVTVNLQLSDAGCFRWLWQE
jgi:hypothetical protein